MVVSTIPVDYEKLISFLPVGLLEVKIVSKSLESMMNLSNLGFVPLFLAKRYLEGGQPFFFFFNLHRFSQNKTIWGSLFSYHSVVLSFANLS